MADDTASSAVWKDRAVSVTEAIAHVRSGDHVFVGTACATPRRLVGALEALETPVAGIRFVHFLTDGVVPSYGDVASTRFSHRTFYVGMDLKDFVGGGRVEYVPISISQVHRLIANGRIPIDVALIQVSPPDDDGRCSLGVSVDLAPAAVRAARVVIAEVNPLMPRTEGDSSVSIDDIDYLTEVDSPVIEYLHDPTDEVAERIARYVARIVNDGSTLQIGLGRVPNEMLKYLANRRDLGIHSDVVTEPLMDLMEQGIVNGARKTVHPHKVVASYCMGTRRFYDYVDRNPAFEFHPIDYVCDPDVIAENREMVSVTQAFAVDLTGQICADQYLGVYGGVSSQPDFVRGAAGAEGGKAIICLASTTDDGAESRIRPVLREGEGVTVARSDVHYVITEYGIAYLFGRSIGERAVALIEVAHPRFRAQLLEEAKRLGYVGSEQTLKSRRAYPAEEERRIALSDDREVLIRPTRTTDVEALQDLFYALSPKDVYTRFFTNLKSLSTKNAQHLCSVSYEEEMAFVAVTGEWEHETVVGSSCYYLDQSTNLADVAYMIRPEWQGLGLGTALQQRTAEYARAQGLRGFTADVLVENKRMIRVFEKSGFRVTKRVVGGDFEVSILFD